MDFKKLSQLIAELQQYMDEHGDVPVFGENYSSQATFVVGKVQRLSVGQPIARLPLGQIQPQTRSWHQYCDLVNNFAAAGS